MRNRGDPGEIQGEPPTCGRLVAQEDAGLDTVQRADLERGVHRVRDLGRGDVQQAGEGRRVHCGGDLLPKGWQESRRQREAVSEQDGLGTENACAHGSVGGREGGA